VYNLHHQVGLENDTSPRMQRYKPQDRPALRAGDFIEYHQARSCERLVYQHKVACAETANATRCHREWPQARLRYAIFSRQWYSWVRAIVKAAPPPKARPRKYCFIGRSPHHWRMERRDWIESFAAKRFDNNSLFVYTDVNTSTGGYLSDSHRVSHRNHTRLGPYDHTLDYSGVRFVPTMHQSLGALESEKVSPHFFDSSYFAAISQCQYMLVPRGDTPWSLRFYEALAVGAIPVVLSRVGDVHRSPDELRIDYRLLFAHDTLDWKPSRYVEAVASNTALFERLHLIPNPYEEPPLHPLCQTESSHPCPDQDEFFGWSSCEQ
jgi:hypothetical protein